METERFADRHLHLSDGLRRAIFITFFPFNFHRPILTISETQAAFHRSESQQIAGPPLVEIVSSSSSEEVHEKEVFGLFSTTIRRRDLPLLTLCIYRLVNINIFQRFPLEGTKFTTIPPDSDAVHVFGPRVTEVLLRL